MSIKSARKKAGYTQAELAAKMGVTAPAVSMWESGAHYPRAASLNKLARILKCSVAKLLKEE